MENIVFLIIGLILGAVIIWFFRKYINEKSNVSKIEFEKLKENIGLLETERNLLNNNFTNISSELDSLKKDNKSLQELKESISNKLSSAETRLETMTSDFETNKQELKDKTIELTTANTKNIELTEKNKNLIEKLETQKKDLEELGSKFTNEFKVLADQILETKSQKFTELNQIKIKEILDPLGKDIEAFKKKVEETYDKESKERFSLEEKIKDLVTSSYKLSKEAENLTLTLKGDSKAQGNWGEDILERILTAAGLKKDVHYQKQATLKDEHGKDLRPDYIINLPDDKVLIIDSKVSLTAYNEYFNNDDDKQKEIHLRAHLASINKHIKDLSEKKYHDLSGSTPNYVIMFIPLDGAFYTALDKEKDFYLKALEKNIVVVTASTLLATLRTISYMWKQEDQKRNVYEIARESGALYDKFVGFINDLEDVGKKLDSTKDKYEDAMNKLVKSTKKGDTIIGRIERIRTLGANTNKALPQDIIDKIEEN